MRGILQSIFSCFIFIHLSFSAKVPVYIWRKQSLENFPAVPALEMVNEETFKADFLSPLLQEKQTLIVYIQDTLSLEDFSSHNEKGKEIFWNLKKNVEKQPSIILPSVDNPSSKLSQLSAAYKVKEIYLNESSVQDIATAADENNVVLLHLFDSMNVADRNKVLNQNDNLVKRVQEALLKVKKPLTYLYTGGASSWDVSTNEARIRRHLLVVDDLNNDTHILNFTNCGILYVRNVTVILAKNYTESDRYFDGDVELAVSNDGISCGNNTTEFNMTFSGEGISGWISMTFSVSFGGWVLNETKMHLIEPKNDPDDIHTLETSEMNAPSGFSYSCWQFVLHISGNDTYTGNFTFQPLQIQPFIGKTEKFSHSFNCVTYFTIPIWMGFLVVGLFTGILAFGIYMLFSIRTMDKFDDPKGKTISVPTAE